MLKVQADNLETVAVLRLHGQIVSFEAYNLRHAMHSLSQITEVKLDLAGVTTVDAGGLGAMLELREQAEAKGIRFELMNVTKRVRMLLEMTRLDTVFQIPSSAELFPAVASRRPRATATALASCA